MKSENKKAREQREEIVHRKGHSLFRKYYSSIAAILAVAMIFLGMAITIVITIQWWNDQEDNMKTDARVIVDEITDVSFDPTDEDQVADIVKTITVVAKATQSEFYVTDTEGNIVICRHVDGNYGPIETCNLKAHRELVISADHMKRALNEGFSEYSALDLNNNNEFGSGSFILAMPAKTDDDTNLAAVFVVTDAIQGIAPNVLHIMEITLLVTLIILLISFVFIYFLCKSITNPILDMKEATRHFAKGEFTYRAKENYDIKYLQEFARSLNKMADELAIEDEAQKSFVANVSHELKTPMTSIGGFIDGIRDGTIPREKEMEYLDIVSGEVKRLARMVVSMLNLSKIESGEVSLSPTEYEVSSQIFETLLSFEQRIDEKHVNIEGFEEMGSVKIFADRDLLQQVIYNLFDNAVKFVDDGGTISVFATRENGGTKVCIRNSGKGVSNSEISRIFERFYKVDKSRSYDTKGVGLGLYIVKTIVNMHDGEITASSDESAWTQFEFFIPDEKENSDGNNI